MKDLSAFALLVGLVLGAHVPAAPAAAEEGAELILATTTSVHDSGLLDALLPLFRERTGIRVKLVAVGSGAALRMGASGDADVLVSHAPEGERELVETGELIDRRPFMENYFLLVGPPEDPAGVRDAPSAPEALRRIAAAEAPFASRADDSGTHRRELALFQEAGLDPEARWPALLRTGAGMGQTLQVAGERRAYVLSDAGTFRAFRERTGLVALSGREPSLRNEYSVLRPNPARLPEGRVRVEEARRLADFLLEPEVQARIGAFGDDGKEGPLFTPLGAGGPAEP